MLRKLLSSAAAVVVLSFAAPVVATPTITGSLDYPNGVDIFAINITNFADFSAISTGSAFGVPDTELFLFSASWLGVYANDDDSAANTLACLPSADGSNPCSSTRPGGVGPSTNGLYYLAITRSANSPLSGGGLNIFTFLNSTDVVGPDLSMGGGSALASWDDGVFTGPDFDLTAFNITLTGAVVLVPEPATWVLIAIGLVLAFARRRQVSPR
jgi:PEP-CTERM motif